MKRTTLKLLALTFLIGLSISACRQDPEIVPTAPEPIDTLPPISDTSDVEGFSILQRLPGIWHGPVTSTTPLGGFTEWIVDFRPISSAQISAKNELDSLNDIFMSFFVAKYDNQYQIGFRNGGGFAGLVRNSYMFIDSVSVTPTEAFYLFADPVAGGKRVNTEITFKDDSIKMHVYTDKYGALSTPETHMIWRAERKDTLAAQDAILLFNFPQKDLVRDMSSDFDGLSDACFYSASADPYPEGEQPNLGVSHVDINISSPATIDPAKKVLIIISTKPLFPGFVFDAAALDSRSRYVFVGAADPTGYDFNYMHPGDYYINAIYDENGDFNFSSGDYMNGSFDIPLSLSDEGSSSESVTINFLIP